MRLLPRILLALVCLTAAAPPAGARQDAASEPRVELQRRANESASRLTRARAEHARLQDEAAALQGQVENLEHRMASLRQTTTRGAALLYKRDSINDSVSGFGDGEAVLSAARRTRLVGTVSDMAGLSARQLDDAARRLRERREAVAARRDGQKRVLAEIAAERRDVASRLEAMARAEQRAERQRQRLSRSAAAAAPRVAAEPPPRPVVPGAFICPINGPVAFSDDFGGRRNHKGNDLMNPKGTQNVAVVAGAVETKPWSGGGIVSFLKGDDGTLYIYMHLMRLVGPYPRHVEQGEVIGLTGATGNASAYHTHFEVRPGGGAAVNPYPLVKAHC